MLKKQGKKAFRISAPVIAVSTSDQNASEKKLTDAALELTEELREAEGPDKVQDYIVVSWNCQQGLTGVPTIIKTMKNEQNEDVEVPLENERTKQAIQSIWQGKSAAVSTAKPEDFLFKIQNIPDDSIIFMHNAHRFLDVDAKQSNVTFIQGVCNLRDNFKRRGCTLVLLAPSFNLPAEIDRDVVAIEDPLPSAEEVRKVVDSIVTSAKLEDKSDVEKYVDSLVGLPAFDVETTFSMSFTRTKSGIITVDTNDLWERKCKAAEKLQGVTINRDPIQFEEIVDQENLQNFLMRAGKGKRRPKACVLLDEFEKQGIGQSNSFGDNRVDMKQTGQVLTFMNDNKVDGLILMGPAGSGKSVNPKAFGNYFKIPVPIVDFSRAQGGLVGSSQRNTEDILRMLKAISQGDLLFIATSNDINAISPEMKRRFTYGIFFVDLLSARGRELCWKVKMKKYGIPDQELPYDVDWTGAEIDACCYKANNLDMSLIESATYITPVAKVAEDKIRQLRIEANGKYIDAKKPGPYEFVDTKSPEHWDSGKKVTRKMKN